MDITRLILDEHGQQRALFAALDEIDRADTEALGAVWRRLHALLESHAEAEERIFYPELLKHGTGAGDSDGLDDEVKDAIKDHNEIRDASGKVNACAVGSDEWFAAIEQARIANSKHMGEEERQDLADFRRHADIALRHALGVRFLASEAQHLTGVEPVDKAPERYVREHQS